MQICGLLTEKTIKVALESDEKESAVAELLELLVVAGDVSDRDGAYDAVMDRESKATTGIGAGVGVPHAKHESIEHLCLALGLAPQGVEFDAIDGEPVTLIFLILAEPDNPGPHVQTLAQVARLCQTPGFTRQLQNAGSADEALRIIAEFEEAQE
jgi:mannitol/fructose-specific phosphotransferase system IIA component (Ntr-type)